MKKFPNIQNRPKTAIYPNKIKTKNTQYNQKKIIKDSNKKKKIYDFEPYETDQIPENKNKKYSFSKNQNQYVQILSNKDATLGDLKWCLKLRNYFDNKNIKKDDDEGRIKTKNFKSPSFYDADLEKYKKRNKTNEIKKRPLTSKISNYNYVNHLLTNRFAGSPNGDIFNFETNLRQYNDNNQDILKSEKNWKDLPYKFLEKQYPIFLPPTTDNDKLNWKKIEKYTYKPCMTEYKKVLVGKDEILQKKYVKVNNGISYGNIGEHLAYGPYTDVFQDINSSKNKHILTHHGNSLCHFELGLRLYGPIIRKKIRRKGKENFNKNINDDLENDKIDLKNK
jgi:hypothetical protein